jgi:protein required for attachment to host cells
MNTDLILIANASEARLLTRSAEDADLVVLDTVLRTANLPPAEARRPRTNRLVFEEGELRVERASGGPLDPLRRRMRQFAAVVARRFERELSEHRFDRVVLCAACPFLSELMRQLSPALKKTLRAVVDADISDLALPDATRRIEQALDSADQALRQGDAPHRHARPPRGAARLLAGAAA